MSALPVIEKDGRVSVPQEVRDAAGLQVGDAVVFTVEGPGKVKLDLKSPVLNLKELIDAYGPGEPIGDWNEFIRQAEEEQADELLRRIREGYE